jgi:hypothetical protein
MVPEGRLHLGFSFGRSNRPKFPLFFWEKCNELEVLKTIAAVFPLFCPYYLR